MRSVQLRINAVLQMVDVDDLTRLEPNRLVRLSELVASRRIKLDGDVPEKLQLLRLGITHALRSIVSGTDQIIGLDKLESGLDALINACEKAKHKSDSGRYELVSV
jgi:hypothetical protein